MYSACRHIKPTGLRCQSPAMRGHAFCYFHAKAHGITRNSVRANLLLPVAEEHAAVQMSVHQIIQALLARQIDAKEAGVMLYGIQIASQTLKVESCDPPGSVLSIAGSSDGEELAPPLCVEEEGDEEGNDDCSNCGHRHNCIDYVPGEDDKEVDQPEVETKPQNESSAEDAGNLDEDNAPENAVVNAERRRHERVASEAIAENVAHVNAAVPQYLSHSASALSRLLDSNQEPF